MIHAIVAPYTIQEHIKIHHAAAYAKVAYFYRLRNLPAVHAFLDTISHCEGTTGEDGYRRVYGSRTLIKDLSVHPGRDICRISRGHKLCSTAAGKYQFLRETWDELVEKYGFGDFGPMSQDLAAISLLDRVGALEDIEHNRLTIAIKKAAHLWASLPTSPYGQPTKSMAEVKKVFRDRKIYYEHNRQEN